MNKYVYNDKENKSLRKKLRNNLGLPEIILWDQLKSSKIGNKFRRQYGVGKYVLDFYCPQIRLGIELDGESHNNDKAYLKDIERQKVIESFGIKVLHFLNKEVLKNLDGVIEEIKREIKNTTSPH